MKNLYHSVYVLLILAATWAVLVAALPNDIVRINNGNTSTVKSTTAKVTTTAAIVTSVKTSATTTEAAVTTTATTPAITSSAAATTAPSTTSTDAATDTSTDDSTESSTPIIASTSIVSYGPLPTNTLTPDFNFYIQSPVEAAVLKEGDTVPIKWYHNAQPIPENLLIELRVGQRSDDTVLTIASKLSYTDGITWIVPSGLDSNYYSIWMEGDSNGKSVVGRSKNFIIEGTGSLPGKQNITVVAPAKGANWQYSNRQTIGWTFTSDTTFFPSQVSVYLLPQKTDSNSTAPYLVKNATYYSVKSVNSKDVNSTDFAPNQLLPNGTYILQVSAYYGNDSLPFMDPGLVGTGQSEVFTISQSADSNSGLKSIVSLVYPFAAAVSAAFLL